MTARTDGSPLFARVDRAPEPQEGFGTLVGETRTKLDLERPQPTVSELHDGTRFDTVVVAAVQNLSVERLRQYPEVADDEGLEQEPEEVEIGEEAIRTRAERSNRERRVDEVPLG